MPDTTGLSENKRALLEKYLRGEFRQAIADEDAIPRRTQGGSVPLSFGQQQVWLLTKLIPGIPVYNECVTIHLPGPLEVAILERSLNQFIQRHEAWRTSFPLVDGQPVQAIHPSLTISLPLVDLRALPMEEREAEVLRLATEDARKLFDLAQCPLLRATLIRLGDEEYRLYLTLHHIIFDGVAIYQVFLPELRAIYETFLHGQPSLLPELPIHYSDYATWQRQWLHGNVLTDQLDYWKKQLEGAPATLELPTDRSRSPVQTHLGSMKPFVLSQELTKSLKSLSRREGVTLYMVLVAAFKTLLYRYSGQDDLLIGTATAGRKRKELQGLMGFFLNTLVLRTDLSGNPTFQELLLRVRKVITSAVAHEDVPFEYLVKELHPERILSQNPLFQVLLTLEPPLTPLPCGWTLTQMDVTVGTSKFDLSLELDDRPEGIIGRFEYNSDLFDAATIGRMVGHWQTLLESIVANPAQPITELPMLTAEERHQFLVEWNAISTTYPRDKCMQQLFEEQVERTPGAVAVVFGDKQLTYRELNAQANQLAHHLRNLGVGPEVLVGLCIERSLEMMVGLLGILKAGGAYEPLDPTYPTERLNFMLNDSQAQLLVTQQQLLPQFPSHGAKVLCLDTDHAVIAQQSTANLLPAANPDNLAYVIYTSGSTGRPKGVQIEHHSLVNFLISMRKQPELTSQDILLAVTTLSFDIAALELFLPLIVGARLVIASREVTVNGSSLATTMARFHISVMQATPATWRLLLEAGWQGNHQLKILCGGEALPLELAQQLLPKAASLWNLYGPTETTIWSTACNIEPANAAVSIGRPIANTDVYLLDRQLQLAPIGVPGELYIGGDGLARGYLNRPELTAERFINHPFSNKPGARLYKTGDIARYRADGTIELIGRNDHQIKLRGFRIELGEIEAALEHHPAILHAVVVAREDGYGDKRLVAYVVPRKKQVVSPGDLQTHVMKQVPSYMVPSSFMLLDELPLTPNGKLDRRALPAPEPTQHTAEETFVAPTLMEQYQLVQIWEDLLDARPIGIKDNFFYLGGHSLLAARLVDRIEQVFRKKLPLATLFAGPTIEQLAHALRDEEQLGSRAPLVTIQTGESRRPFFFLHGDWYGGSFYCFTLARELGLDQPFYVLEPYRFDGLRVAPSFEAMAAAHIETLRAFQPKGPYSIGGFCSGALIAFEMAQQLRAAGQSVDLLAMIETGVAPPSLRLTRNCISCIGKLLRIGPDKQLDWFLRLRHVFRLLQHTPQKYMQSLAVFPGPAVLRQDGTGIYGWLAANYIHREYPGKATFFWASEKRDSRRIAWGNVNKDQCEVHIIPGGHYDLITNNLSILTSQLCECLNNVDQPGFE
jgi:amino acid adenylation domain-containing protein